MPISYMPGDTSKLEKAYLSTSEGKATKIEVKFNPKEVTIDKQVAWQEHKGSEDDAPTLEWTAGHGKSMNCELMFDMFEDQGDVYATYIQALEYFVLKDNDLGRPPLTTFTWGNNKITFKGVVEDLNVKYTLFLPDGTPCRATVQLKMKESGHLLNKKDAKKAYEDEKKAKQKGVNAPAGQRMDTTAQQTGDGSNWKATADRNNVSDPQNPPGGTYRGPQGR